MLEAIYNQYVVQRRAIAEKSIAEIHNYFANQTANKQMPEVSDEATDIPEIDTPDDFLY